MIMLNSSAPIILQGKTCSLVPLSFDHHDALVDSVNDGELWKLWYTFVPKPQDMYNNIASRLDMQVAGSMIPFAVVENNSGKAIGMTTFMNIDITHCRL